MNLPKDAKRESFQKHQQALKLLFEHDNIKNEQMCERICLDSGQSRGGESKINTEASQSFHAHSAYKLACGFFPP